MSNYSNGIDDIDIEELLGRDPVIFANNEVERFIRASLCW